MVAWELSGKRSSIVRPVGSGLASHRPEDIMVLIGCFLPFLLAIAGAVIGHLIGSGTIGLWGMAIGFAAGLALAAIIGLVAMRAKNG
jgi:hypothetical protein